MIANRRTGAGVAVLVAVGNGALVGVAVGCGVFVPVAVGVADCVAQLTTLPLRPRTVVHPLIVIVSPGVTVTTMLAATRHADTNSKRTRAIFAFTNYDPAVNVKSYVLCNPSPFAPFRLMAVNTERSNSTPADAADKTPCSVTAGVPLSSVFVPTVR